MVGSLKKWVLVLAIVTLNGGDLRLSGVKPLLEEVFTYHIDHKEFSPLIAQRAFRNYIAAFDMDYTYLLKGEVAPYLNLSSDLLNRIVFEYGEGKFHEFVKLNKTISFAVGRARKMRQAIKSELLKKSGIEMKELSLNFVETADQLHRNTYQLMQNWLALYAREAKKEVLTAEERLKVLNFYEKKRRQHEDLFLLSTDKSEGKLSLHILKAITEGLDAHTKYYSSEEADEIRAILQKQFCGVGVKLVESVEGPTVAKILPGSPAERSKVIEKGDVLTEINGIDVSLLYFKDVLNKMSGQEGSKALFTFEKPSHEKIRLDLVRERIIVDEERIQVAHEHFADGVIGKITLSSFYDNFNGVNVEKDLREAIKELKAIGPLHGLVIDMRRNSGGFLHQAVHVAGLFSQQGVVVIAKYAGDEVQFSRARDFSKYYDGPLVLLTSKASASAAEIVAAALRDEGVAIVVGDERTYGKGSMQFQTITDPSAQNFFKVTVGRYYTASGKSTQVEGVKADIHVATAFAPYQIGERYLRYPIPNLPLISGPDIKQEIKKICSANAQRKQTRWEKMIPQLRHNSQARLLKDKNFQAFLAAPSKKCGSEDLQMHEASEVIKDMVFLGKKLS